MVDNSGVRMEAYKEGLPQRVIFGKWHQSQCRVCIMIMRCMIQEKLNYMHGRSVSDTGSDRRNAQTMTETSGSRIL